MPECIHTLTTASNLLQSVVANLEQMICITIWCACYQVFERISVASALLDVDLPSSSAIYHKRTGENIVPYVLCASTPPSFKSKPRRHLSDSVFCRGHSWCVWRWTPYQPETSLLDAQKEENDRQGRDEEGSGDSSITLHQKAEEKH